MSTLTAPDPGTTLVDALLRADHADAVEALQDALETGLDPIQVLDVVVAPALHEIGRRREQGRIGIAEEHVAAAVAQRMLAGLAPMLVTAPQGSRGTVLMASLQGERHLLGLHMASDVLEGAGYRVKLAGADLPAPALVAWAERERPELVAISSTSSWAAAADIRSALTQLLEAQPQIGIVLGGAGWRGFPLPDGDRVMHVESMRRLLPAADALSGG